MEQIIKRKVGRPKGYRLSTKSKNKISASKKGHKHTEETKQKISEGVRKLHETGAPIEILMNTDLSECGQFKDSEGYVDVCIPNPIVGELAYQQRLHVAIMEQRLNRKLRKNEEIHHWGEKDDQEIITLCSSRAEHIILDKAKMIMNRELA